MMIFHWRLRRHDLGWHFAAPDHLSLPAAAEAALAGLVARDGIGDGAAILSAPVLRLRPAPGGPRPYLTLAVLLECRSDPALAGEEVAARSTTLWRRAEGLLRIDHDRLAAKASGPEGG